MISSEEASAIISRNYLPLASELVDLPKALGRVLDEQVVADRNFPPFDRVMMDGVAIRYAELQKGGDTFKVIGQQTAGTAQMELKEVGGCLEVMTGAILPQHADSVIKFEDIVLEEGRARILNPKEVRKGQHVHPEGSDRSKDEVLISEGTMIRPSEIAILSTVGKARVRVKSLPKVAVVSTGDELVEVDQVPARHQIRTSNSAALRAQMERMGITASLFHFVDEKDKLLTALGTIIASYDIVILSGGVSKGRKDFVPEVLEELQVSKLFHGVLQRPGKPFWFGRTSTAAIFALPGNPVSTFMCFHKYVAPYIQACTGIKENEQYAKLAGDFEFSPDLTYFLQVRLVNTSSGEMEALPIPGGGSGDLANLIKADAFMELPANKGRFLKGEVYKVLRY